MMKKKMKKIEVLALANALKKVGTLRGVKFAYAIAKTKQAVDKEVKAIEEPITPTKEWEEIEKKQRKIYEDCCVKDESGNQVPDSNGMLVIDPAKKGAHEKALKKLEKDNQELYDERKKLLEEYNKDLKESDVEIQIHQVEMEHIPDSISVAQFDGIMPLVKD